MSNGRSIRALGLLAGCHLLLLGAPSPGAAGETIPPDILAAVSATKPVPPTIWTFGPDQAADISPDCNLTAVDLLKQTEKKPPQTFSLLTEKSSADATARTQILVQFPRMSVDADGAARAYHPDDPFGRGICEKVTQGNKVSFRGVCALDRIANAGVRIFNGAVEVPYLVEADKTEADGTVTKRNVYNPQYETTWNELWPRAAKKQIASADLPLDRVALYSSELNAAAVFKTKIIPFRDGLPCTQGPDDPAPGYFVSETAPLAGTSPTPDNLCRPALYRDSTEIPYVVIPEGLFENISVGDIAIGYAKTTGQPRIIRGIVGDIGPKYSFGEASIAFNQQLRNDLTAPMNSIEADRLDTNLSESGDHKGIESMFVLFLGKTAPLLNGDYSAVNIDQVAARAIETFKGESRLSACAGELDKRDSKKSVLEKADLNKSEPARR
jgi:Fungal chitosanase of glycosyl hydrolase group 75